MGEFSSPEAIQLKAKFAFENQNEILIKKSDEAFCVKKIA